MALRIRRGTEPQRTGVTLEMGEIVWTTDAKQLWVGDGLQPGGHPVVGANVAGFGLVFNTSSKRLEVGGLTTNDIPEGTNNKYFSEDLAQDAAALLFSTGSHTGITFQYDDTLGKINAVVTLDVSTSDNIRELAQDSVWSMLENGSHSNIAFTYTDNGAATGTINATVTLDGVGIASVSADLSPTLGGNLVLNSRNITGTGNINISGDIQATGDLTISGDVSVGAGSTLTSESILSNGVYTLTGTANGFGVYTNVGNGLDLNTYRGPNSAPTALLPGDAIGNFTLKGFDGTVYNLAGAISAQFDATATVTDVYPKSTVSIFAGAGGENVVIASFNGTNGVFTAPRFSVGDGTAANPSIVFTTDTGSDTGIFHPADGILCISTDSTERVRVDNGGMRVEGFMKVKNVNGTLPASPEAGMIVLDGATFKGYDGSAWVNLN